MQWLQLSNSNFIHAFYVFIIAPWFSKPLFSFNFPENFSGKYVLPWQIFFDLVKFLFWKKLLNCCCQLFRTTYIFVCHISVTTCQVIIPIFYASQILTNLFPFPQIDKSLAKMLTSAIFSTTLLLQAWVTFVVSFTSNEQQLQKL